MSDERSNLLSLQRLRRQYDDYCTLKTAEREEAEAAARYYHGDQYTAEELETLNERKQPAIVYNRIQRKIDGIVGLVERLRQDPKAYPRTPQHEQGAELATQALNFALDQSRWKDMAPEIARDASLGPVGGVELELVEGKGGDYDIVLHQIDRSRFFYDPRSRKADFSDARFMGTRSWIDRDLAVEMFPDKEDEIDDLIASGGSDAADGKQAKAWVVASAKSLLLVEHWYKIAGAWRFAFYSGDRKLMDGESPFVDEKGGSACRYIAFSASVDYDDDRYGFFRNLKGPQDELNHRRSKGLHALNTTRIVVEQGSMEVDDYRREMHKPDGVMVVPPGGKVQQIDNSALAQGNFDLLAEAKNEIENFGPNPALIGQGIEAKSGRAIAMLQQAGIAELGPYLIAYRAFKTRVYRSVWANIQRYWTGERWIRVTDDEGMASFVAVNRMGVDQFGRPSVENALGTLDVDLILDEGPDQVNSMADAFDTLIALAQQGATVPPQIIIELSSLPASVKKRVLGALEQAQQANPIQQQAQQIELAGAAAKVDETKARAAKLMSEAGVGAHKAETDRAKAVTERKRAAHSASLDEARLANDQMTALAGAERKRAQALGLIERGFAQEASQATA